MAWQEPKTNWQPPDGVRNTDMNRIEGNILELRKKRLNEDITYYVRASGSDATGTGTSSAPFRSIMHALRLIPYNLGGHSVTINIGTGTYDEDIIIANFSNGKIHFTGPYNSTATIRSLEVRNAVCEIASLRLSISYGATTTYASAIYVGERGFLSCTGVINIIGVADSETMPCGLYVADGSSCRIGTTLAVTYATTAAVRVSGASRCHILLISGSYNTAAVIAEEGSIVSYGSTNITTTATNFITRSGGRIYTGGQTSLPNY